MMREGKALFVSGSTERAELEVILIDEYDVPLQKAAVNVFYKDMIGIIGPMLSLSEALKSNDENVSKGILTGCLRATKEGIFTGLNNYTVNSVLTQNRILCTALGFTPDEVREMLSCFGLEKLYDKAREYYDGYSVYGRDLFCPWDVTSYIGSLLASDDPAAIKPEAFWNNTSNSDVITHFMPNLNSADAQRFQVLLDGKSVKVKIDEGMSYGDYDLNNPAQFWNVLVYTGCLTLAVNPEKVDRWLRRADHQLRRDRSPRSCRGTENLKDTCGTLSLGSLTPGVSSGPAQHESR